MKDPYDLNALASKFTRRDVKALNIGFVGANFADEVIPVIEGDCTWNTGRTVFSIYDSGGTVNVRLRKANSCKIIPVILEPYLTILFNTFVAPELPEAFLAKNVNYDMLVDKSFNIDEIDLGDIEGDRRDVKTFLEKLHRVTAIGCEVMGTRESNTGALVHNLLRIAGFDRWPLLIE